MKTFKILQYNITCILHINSSNRMFCSIHDFTFLMKDTNIKEQVSLDSWEKKKLFGCAIFSKMFYVAYAINRTGKLICLYTCPQLFVSEYMASKKKFFSITIWSTHEACMNKNQTSTRHQNTERMFGTKFKTIKYN